MHALTKTRISTVLLPLLLATLLSCSDDWLDVKRDRSLIVPTSLKDMRLLLRNETITSKDYLSLATMAVEDYYLPDENYSGRTLIERFSYVWASDLYGADDRPVEDWDQSYAQVLVANVVLEGLEKIERTSVNQEEWDDVKGGALHLRARAFYNLAQTFSKPFSAAGANSDLGIPLRLTADPGERITRATLAETYERIVTDFEQATRLLRETPEFIRDPSVASAHGWAARCFLSMGHYEKALFHANECLKRKSELLDFNDLNASATYPIPIYNKEVVQHSEINPLYAVFSNSTHRIPESFRTMYSDNDLRKVIFFRDRNTGDFGTYGFRGGYTGGLTPFSGIAVNEMYLIRAECLARTANAPAAMEDLNTLLRTRYMAGTYVDLVTDEADEALAVILTERRKELLFRGLRWSDLRRLNQDPTFAETVSRTLNGEVYSLTPDDPRYVMPIPHYVIHHNSIPQNIR